ncbi:Ubiquitin-conjugating enzyme E2 C [Theobroma cacao]|uniref:Ubiquitin-conjugating enzyme E2 C n=1 Tax=Theobroma cacao TaxID=3641 RepID=A0A061FNY6_THECC|nr:Ubiquitin-conjugating enzyme E2 C [Theobroma cacao]
MEDRPNRTVDNSSTSPQQHQSHAAAASSKQPVTAPDAVDTTSVTQRLQKELMALMGNGCDFVYGGDVWLPIRLCLGHSIISHLKFKSKVELVMTEGDLGVSAFPEGESIFAWIGTIEGGKGTMYEGLSYKISMRFPLDYPFKPPQVKFETMCFHPNVDQFGNICLDILQDKWSSAYDCRTILLSVQSLLGEPNPESPLNTYAAALLNNEEDYRKMVQEQYFGEKTSES